MRTATINRHLPWEAIRRDWETSSIEMLSLARKYGVASTTTLTRRRVSEGWTRDPTAVAVRRRTRADGMVEALAIEETAGLATAAPMAPHGDPEHAAAATGQCNMAIANQMKVVGLLLLRRLAGVLQPPSNDEAAEALMMGNLQRLIRINPDRETLAGLMTAVCKIISTGVTLESHAIAANTASRLVSGTPATSAGFTRQMVTDVLRTMDTEAVRGLRAWALEVTRARRAAQIAATTAGPAGSPTRSS